ncbi:uncharacterized protein LOC117340621 [Pecten maximus]|uniref:uncharacterized protein LOC117340621 n=1 Tax=Pecten maximus TaxID=6579 RepID=UPI001458FB3D|nr:uncharacterized protein LOC117340621 [Pecten maximus]
MERFNKTLVTMLSAFVNEHHTDWDEMLPYVTMAYRSVEQETTGCTPNYLMLGREVTTPLDIQYEMPVDDKSIPENEWVWTLQERIEEAHRFVRLHTDGEMRRQKKYHDQKAYWNQYKPNDSVFVFFPRVKPGKSRTLTSMWQGPFKVIGKCTDVTYKIPCGYRGKPQVIHVDRMSTTRRGES